MSQSTLPVNLSPEEILECESKPKVTKVTPHGQHLVEFLSDELSREKILST